MHMYTHHADSLDQVPPEVSKAQVQRGYGYSLVSSHIYTHGHTLAVELYRIVLFNGNQYR